MTASALGRGGAPWCGAPGRPPSPRAARSQEEASRRTRPPNPSYSLLGFRVHPPRPLKGELFLNANASIGAFVDTVGYAQSEDALASGNQRDRNTFGYAYSEDALASGNPRNRNAFGYAYSEDALASVQNASVASILSKKCVTVVIFRTWKLQNARMASILSKKCVTVVVFKPSKRQNASVASILKAKSPKGSRSLGFRFCTPANYNKVYYYVSIQKRSFLLSCG